MPDLLTHIIIGLIIAKIFNLKKSLVLIGAILPDMIYKVNLLRYFIHLPENFIQFALLPFHSPIGLIIITILLSYLFRYPKKKTITQISIGWLSHLILDLTNKHFLVNQVYPFLPFIYMPLEVGWFWPHQYYYLLAFSIILLVLLYFPKNILMKGFTHNRRQ